MRRAFPLIIGLSLVLPLIAFGKTLDAAVNDVQLFRQVLDQDLSDQQMDQLQAAREGGSELFPDLGTGSTDQRKEDLQHVEPFVTLKENGLSYTLKDVPRSAWFAPYVQNMVDLEIVSGYRDANGRPTGEFKPNQSVSIEEMAAMVLRATGTATSSCTGTLLNKAAEKSWSKDVIACAEKFAWPIFSDGTINIARPAVRAEVVATILTAFNVQQQQPSGSGTIFKDVTSSTQFAASILAAVRDGIVAGYADANGNATGMFGPANPVTRAEISKMLSNAVQLYKK